MGLIAEGKFGQVTYVFGGRGGSDIKIRYDGSDIKILATMCWAGIDSLPCIVRTVGYFLRPCSTHGYWHFFLGDQSKSKWDYYGVVDDQNRPHQVVGLSSTAGAQTQTCWEWKT